MKYTATDEKLILECSPEEQAELRGILAESTTGVFTGIDEHRFMEPLIANSELDWVNPDDTGDLTTAPMLGVTGPETVDGEQMNSYPNPIFGWVPVGSWDGHAQYAPIHSRWGYPHYMLRSFLQDLLDTGKTIFISSW